jgi:hypothetical protein
MNGFYLILSLLFFLCLSQDSNSEIKKREIEPKRNISTTSGIESDEQNFNLLILGGGYSPSGNEVSLESNVKYLLRKKDKIGLSKFKTKTLFADGLASSRDIKYRNPTFTVPEPNLILAEIFGSTRGIYNQYRNNHLNADGASSIKEFDDWINDLNSSSDQSSNLIYFTGHGGKGEKKTPNNTTAYLWNNYKFKVSEFTKKLDGLPADQTYYFGDGSMLQRRLRSLYFSGRR